MLEGFQFLKLQKLLVSNESFWALKIVALFGDQKHVGDKLGVLVTHLTVSLRIFR